MPACGGGGDFVGIGGSYAGLCLQVVVDDEAVDGRLQIDDALENAALETTPGEDGEEALDGVEPTGGGGREVERPAGMSAQPFDHLGVLAVINDRPQSLTICWAQMDDNASAHPADSHDAARSPNPDSFVPINPLGAPTDR